MSTNPSEETQPSEAVHLSSSLMAASKFVGHLCDAENAMFIDCKKKNQHPSHCIPAGKLVTSCAERAIQLQEQYCPESFRTFTKCLEHHANTFKHCKSQQSKLDNCVATEIIPKLGRKF